MNAAPPQPPPTPHPLRERPPDDRYCDLILNGGVASGVVYPWAVLKLARHYRFRNIGGNSVGAMAAALAAAAEFGRCHGQPDAFEVLRRTPLELAEEERGRSRMLRLFQPSPGVRRLFQCLEAGIRHFNAGLPRIWASVLLIRDVLHAYRLGRWCLAGVLVLLLPALLAAAYPAQWIVLVLGLTGGLALAERTVGDHDRRLRAILVVALVLLLLVAHGIAAVALGSVLPALGVLGWPLVVVLALGLPRLWPELCAFKDNGWGLCTGQAQPAQRGEQRQQALLEWLHEGIQRSAGRTRDDPPLTFTDLWNAPRSETLPEDARSIALQMYSTNVTLARPVAWPLLDGNTRLFFREEEWALIFPRSLLDAVVAAAAPYAPAGDSDPRQGPQTKGLREIPAGDLPIAVAARMSLSYPLLFSCVPVWAIDYEGTFGERVLRKCQLTDGGLCTNFPIHLFDAAHPQWPTFGLMLSRRLAKYQAESVWLPLYHLSGRADNWLRNVPGAGLGPEPGPLKGLAGLLGGMLSSALEWNDNLTTRLPHARNRVLRMWLKPGEGQLHITMPGRTILKMAHEYGTLGGRKLVDRFVARKDQAPTAAWQEHLYVRALNQLQALTRHLRGYGESVTCAGFSKPLAEILAAAAAGRPLSNQPERADDPLGAQLTPQQAQALQAAVDAVASLEQALEATVANFGPYQAVPPTLLQLRSRL